MVSNEVLYVFFLLWCRKLFFSVEKSLGARSRQVMRETTVQAYASRPSPWQREGARL